jgi:hypothetical protein
MIGKPITADICAEWLDSLRSNTYTYTTPTKEQRDMYEVQAVITLTDEYLGNISIRFYCDSCHEIAEVDPTFFQESGTPCCGNDSCRLVGEDMEVIGATITVNISDMPF